MSDVDTILQPAPAGIRPEAMTALRALGEPQRIRIIELLRHGEHCVCDVGQAVGLSTSLVSHHLRVLSGAGLVHERRSGRWVFYSLDLEHVARLREAVDVLLSADDVVASQSACSDCGRAPSSPPIDLLKVVE